MAREPIASPLQRRSQYLAQALEQMNKPPERIAGYGDLGARLLAQALTQRAAEKTEGALQAEQSNKDLARRQGIAAGIGETVEGTPQEVGNGRLGNPITGLVNAIRGRGQPEPVAAPQAPAQAPAPAMMPTNTQEPVSSPIAPVAPVQGAPLPEQAPMQAPASAQPAPQMQQPAPEQNPLAATPQERQMIVSDLNSGDPERVARAEQMVQDIQLRQAQPAALRYEYQAVNGVPGVVDPVTRQWTPIEGGIPQQAMNENQIAGAGNVFGVAEGTGVSLNPFGVPTIVGRPPEGFERVGGGLRAERGGPQDQSTGGNQIANERSLRTEYQRATDDYRAARNGYQKVQAAAADDSGASDVALIFGFMKTLDPQSTVREGEFATAQNTGSVPERVQAAYNRAITGDRLTPEQRREFVQTAATQFATYEQGYQDRTAEYISMAEQYGLNPENVVGRATPPREASARPAPARPRQSAPPRQQPATPPQRRYFNPATGAFQTEPVRR